MKLQFKHQKFQADAESGSRRFAGQPYLTPSYMMDRGTGNYQVGIDEEKDFTGWSNGKLYTELSDGVDLRTSKRIQRNNQIEPSRTLEGKFNLTIEWKPVSENLHLYQDSCMS